MKKKNAEASETPENEPETEPEKTGTVNICILCIYEILGGRNSYFFR